MANVALFWPLYYKEFAPASWNLSCLFSLLCPLQLPSLATVVLPGLFYHDLSLLHLHQLVLTFHLIQEDHLRSPFLYSSLSVYHLSAQQQGPRAFPLQAQIFWQIHASSSAAPFSFGSSESLNSVSVEDHRFQQLVQQ